MYHLSRQKRAENWMAKCQTLLVDWPVKTVAKEIDKIVNSQLTVKNKRCHSSTFPYIILIRATLLSYLYRIRVYKTPVAYKNIRVFLCWAIRIFLIFAQKAQKKWRIIRILKKWRFNQQWRLIDVDTVVYNSAAAWYFKIVYVLNWKNFRKISSEYKLGTNHILGAAELSVSLNWFHKN